MNSDEEKKLIGIRVRKIRKKLGFSQKKLADTLELSAGFISDVEAGNTLAGQKFIKNIFLKLNVNLKYLFQGKGEMFLEEEDESIKLDFDHDRELIKEMFEMIKKSSLVRLSVLQFYQTYMFEKKTIIHEELESTKPKEKK